ncbi:unnamed protein product, partial [Rotaria sp. Silwood1]
MVIDLMHVLINGASFYYLMLSWCYNYEQSQISITRTIES